ncbi:CopG family transcriptional regulator [Bacillaceae bacterium W0354]
MSKKKLTITIDEQLFNEIEQKAKQLGIAKSAFVGFASSYFLHQLKVNEKLTRDHQLNVYDLIKRNIEMQKETLD